MAPEGSLRPALASAVEGLYEDERLRSQLTDDEAGLLLAWAQAEIEEAARSPAAASADLFQEHVRRVRAAARDVNDLVGERAALADGSFLVRLMGILSPGGAVARALPEGTRDLVAQRNAIDSGEFIRRITALISDSWRMGGGSRRRSREEERLLREAARRAGNFVESGGLSRIRLSPLVVLGIVIVVGLIAAGALIYFSRQEQPAAVPSQPPAAGGSPGWYQLYFTAPRYPDNAANHRGSLDEKLTAFIDTATKSVDMAIYQLDLDNVTRAMLDAKGRGATVRVVTDVDILDDPKENPSFKRLQAAGITVVAGNPNAIMHDKFVVVDDKAVWTGSWNFTTNDTYRYNNNGILVQSPELAKSYTATFEKMWRDRKFGAQRKAGGTTPKLVIGGTPVEDYFAPEDGVAEKIVDRLRAAQRTIDFMTFSFTDDEIGATVSGRAKAGVKVRGVFEKTGSETQFSEYGRMKSAGLDVLQDGNPYLMHHKVFIIDGRTTVFGSFNISKNAETSNDENLLIVDEDAMAGLFTQEFERVQAQAKGPPSRDNAPPAKP